MISKTTIAPPKNKITVYFPSDLMTLWEAYVKEASGEISVIGGVKRTSSSTVRIVDLFLIHQKCSSGTTDFDEDKYAEFLNDLVLKGYPTENLKLWMHSHASMDTFWSGTDEKNIEDSGQDDFFLSIVSNKAGKHLARLDIFSPFRLCFNDVIIVKELPISILDRVRNEIAEKVTNIISPNVTNFPGYRGSQWTGPIKSYSSPSDQDKIKDPNWIWIPDTGTRFNGYWMKITKHEKINAKNSCFNDQDSGIPAEKSDHKPLLPLPDNVTINDGEDDSIDLDNLEEYDYNDVCNLATSQGFNVRDFFIMEGMDEYYQRDECIFYLDIQAGKWYIVDPLAYQNNGLQRDLPFKG